MSHSEICLEMDCNGEDWCEITCASRLLGRKWHPVIIYHLLMSGPLFFNELNTRITSISNKVLSSNLDRLEDYDLVRREVTRDRPPRVRYGLTELGQSLEPVVTALQEWGGEYLVPPTCDAAEETT